jgi:hypothetical protein
MVPEGIHRMATTSDDPAHAGKGSAMVVLDRGGRLVALDVIAASDSTADSLAGAAPMDSARGGVGFGPFGSLLSAAGFDTTTLVPARPRREPGVYAERTAAWRAPGGSSTSRAVEVGAVGSRVVHFALTDSAHSTAEIIRRPAPSNSGDSFADWFTALFFSFGATAATVLLARRNLLAGRGDRRGATRLAIFVLVVNLLESVFTHPLGQRGVPALLIDLVDGRGIGHSLLHAVTMWFAYVAIEPYVRRLWPDILVGWARLLSGRVRDPLVGRDVVIGGVAGLALCLVSVLAYKGAIAMGWLAPRDFPEAWALAPLGSMGVMAYGVVWSASVSVLTPLWTLVSVLLVHFAVRQRTWAAVIAWGLSTTVAALTATEPGTLVPTLIDQGLGNAVLLFILVRWGLLAGIVAGFVVYVIAAVPATLDLSAWYIDRTALGVGVVALLMAWGFKNAIAGQAVFQDPLAEKRPSQG